MTIKTRLKGLGAIALMSGLALHAGDDSLGFDLKLRTSYAPSTKDNLHNNGFGFGVNVHNTFSWGTLNAELGYFYNAGREYRGTLQAPAAGQPAADPANSVEMKKNSLDQINLRLSYEASLAEGWTWQGGLQVGRTKFRHEYIGDVGDTGWATYEDTYNGTPTKSKLTVSPFVGVSYRISKESSLEFNLMSFSYTAIDFSHNPGSALVSGSTSVPGSHLVYAGDKLVESNRNSLRIELGYTFRF